MTSHKSDVQGLMALAISLECRPRVVDGTGILMLNGQWQGIPSWAALLLNECIIEIEAITELKVEHVSINIVLPGGGSGLHTDPTPSGPLFKRWHLPLETNPGCWFEAQGERVHMAQGTWHGPIEYWLPHAVGNDGETPRMHLICDLR